MSTESLQFLELARKILNEEYAQAHTAEYNTWLNNHKNAWMQPHVVVPFPPFVVNSALTPFKPKVTCPTEADILARALEIYKQANPPSVQTATPSAAQSIVPDTVAETDEPIVVEQPAVIEPVAVEQPVVVEQPAVEPVVVEQPAVAEPVVVEQPAVETVVVEEKKPISGKLLSSNTEGLSSEEKIREIFKPIDDTMFKDTTIESAKQELKAVPQPEEELSKLDSSAGSRSSTFFQKLKDKWSAK